MYDFSVDDVTQQPDRDYVDRFDKWIKESPKAAWLRDMKIFSSVHGHLLQSPIFPSNKPAQPSRDLVTLLKQEKLYDKLYQDLKDNELDDTNTLREISKEEVDDYCADFGFKGAKKLKFKQLVTAVHREPEAPPAGAGRTLYYERETLRGLMDLLRTISHQTARFANNLELLNDQINNINKCLELSLEKRVAACNSQLKWFNFDAADREQVEAQTLMDSCRGFIAHRVYSDSTWNPSLKVQNAMVAFDFDERQVKAAFQKGFESLVMQLKLRDETLSDHFRQQLVDNKETVVETIRNRKRRAKQSEKLKEMGKAAAAVSVVGVVAGGVATLALGGLPLLLGTVGIMSEIATGVVGVVAVSGVVASAEAGAVYMVAAAASSTPRNYDNKLSEKDLEELDYFETK